MTSLSVTLGVPDPSVTQSFLTTLGVDGRVRAEESIDPTAGFRGYTLSLVVSQPSGVDALISSALAGGATELKPVKKTFWGYGGVVQAPDGSIWKVASSSKKNSAPPTREIEQIVLLLGAQDVAATKKFYVDRGLPVGKSFGSKYVEFTGTDGVKLALYGRKALAKDAGVPPEGDGSHRLVVTSSLGSFTDPDGFAWRELRS